MFRQTPPLRLLLQRPPRSHPTQTANTTHITRAYNPQPRNHPARSRPRPSMRPARPSRSAPAPPVYVETGLVAALVGRPNVGKSTLFNRLSSALRGRGLDGPRNPTPLVFVKSVVDAAPGVTRDPRDALAAVLDLRFRIVDTAGLEGVVSEAVALAEECVVGDGVGVGEGAQSLVAATALCPDRFYRQMYKAMEAGTVGAVADANLILFVVDASEDITEIDRAIARWLHGLIKHKSHAALESKQVLLLANKCDTTDADAGAMDAYSLGFGEPIVMSAEHNLGFGEFYTALVDVYRRKKEADQLRMPHNSEEPENTVAAKTEKEEEQEDLLNSFDDELILGSTERKNEEPLRQLIVSILGRPNVGKSTLLNRLVGWEKSVVGPVAGVTRDAVLCEWDIAPGVKQSDSIPIWLVDTAGIRPQVKVEGERLERLSVRSSFRALRHSHVVVIVLDSQEPLCAQDMKLLDVAVAEGRAVVLVVNKMDKVKLSNLHEWKRELRYKIDSKVTELAGVEIVEMSAKDWSDGPQQARRLYAAIQRARERWEKRIPTSSLNRFVAGFNERMSVGGGITGERRNRIGVTKFITQKKIRPPMFRLDGSSAVSMNYLRALTNALRKEFGFEGVPIRVKRPSRRRRK